MRENRKAEDPQKGTSEEIKAPKIKSISFDDPETKAGAEMVKNEINLLANSLRLPSVSESETFSFNPFPAQPKGYFACILDSRFPM